MAPVRRILITGSRDWVDRSTIWGVLNAELVYSGEQGIVVVHGGARGADDIADRWAWGHLQAGWPVEVEAHLADWDEYGSAAGPIRNREMVALGADVCHAFPLKGSVGTYGCMRLARDAGIRVVNHGYPEEGR